MSSTLIHQLLLCLLGVMPKGSGQNHYQITRFHGAALIIRSRIVFWHRKTKGYILVAKMFSYERLCYRLINKEDIYIYKKTDSLHFVNLTHREGAPFLLILSISQKISIYIYLYMFMHGKSMGLHLYSYNALSLLDSLSFVLLVIDLWHSLLIWHVCHCICFFPAENSLKKCNRK